MVGQLYQNLRRERHIVSIKTIEDPRTTQLPNRYRFWQLLDNSAKPA